MWHPTRINIRRGSIFNVINLNKTSDILDAVMFDDDANVFFLINLLNHFLIQ